MIDVSLIGAAAHTIDLASYSLTDALVLDALNAAERRGVKIRIVLDPRERHDFARLGDLSDAVRIKRGGRGGRKRFPDQFATGRVQPTRHA